jgi:hypothetical protein
VVFSWTHEEASEPLSRSKEITPSVFKFGRGSGLPALVLDATAKTKSVAFVFGADQSASYGPAKTKSVAFVFGADQSASDEPGETKSVAFVFGADQSASDDSLKDKGCIRFLFGALVRRKKKESQ